MKSFKKDYAFGKCEEIKIKSLLEKSFNDVLISTADFYRYDYEGNNNVYEVKSRRNEYNKYPTTLMPAYKIKTKKTPILVFIFFDGIYYIKYEEQLFNTFEKKMFVRQKREDYNDLKQEYIFIPIDKLTKLI
jgi:hypothetical protein